MASNYQVGNLELRITSYANTATQSLGKMNTQLDRTRKTLKNVGIFATFGKLNYMTNMMRYYGRAVANVVQYAMDYVETLNLWQVANRENIELADEFIAKMNKAYGVSEQTLMNYQAIFKNMLAALGDLSDAVSSQLSMQLTQMALDFSSLYNVTIERAMTVYQSILSGQVRPVRSISGMDITENTIFDLYQQAGGAKTVRQLSQIEKRLLRIAAIFDQMGASGAIGDMEKTIESASNQARVMGEQLKEVLTWSGQVILLWLNNNRIFQYINAALMTMREIMKSIAYDLDYEEQNFLDGMITQAENADEALDEVQGKLLSFDKFEALNSTDSNVLGIDPVIEDLIANINLEMSDFQMQASKISEEWLKALGFVDENGDGIYEMSENAKNLLNVIKNIIISVGVLLGLGLAKRLFTFITGIKNLKGALNSLLAVGIIMLLLNIIDAFKNGDTAAAIISITIGVVLVGAFVALRIAQYKAAQASAMATLGLEKQNYVMLTMAANTQKTSMAFRTLGISITTAVASFLIFDTILNSLDPSARKIVSILGLVVSALTAVAVAAIAAHGAMTWGVAIPIITAAVGVGIASIKGLISSNIPAYASGGFVEEGQLFVAREAGPEMVGTMGGRTTVANNDQIVEGISQGVYEAVISANSQNNQQLTGNVYIDGSKVGKVVAKPVYTEGVRIGVFKKA